MSKLSTILDQVDSGTLLLPEFQRGYVWNRDQVRGLMLSLYRGHPVGGLLLWESDADTTAVRGNQRGSGTRLLLLDGQQRITSLYGVIRGRAPVFFEGNPAAFTGLCFNVRDEAFEFYAPSKMAGDPTWIRLSELYQRGLAPFITNFLDQPTALQSYVDRLNRLLQIAEREFHEEKITGKDKTIEVVVDIFNRVNSGGTHLSKGDLALAHICAASPGARQAMREQLEVWRTAGYRFSLDWLLRNVTAVATGRSVFTALENIDATEFEVALKSAGHYVGGFLDAVSSRLGFDHDRVLMGRGGIPVVSRLLHLSGGSFHDAAHRDKVLFWYVHSALWGRFAGSTETVLQHDYDVVDRAGVDGLIAGLERWRGGNLTIAPHDFEGSTTGSRFYPLLYLLTRVTGARDLGSGLKLQAGMLGKNTGLQMHHIFPKAVLYKEGYDRSLVNAVANFCFLTQDTNLVIGKRHPARYLAEVEEKHPGALASQWIPTDPALWELDRYEDFLEARRELLAVPAQAFMAELRSGAGAADAISLQRVEVVAAAADDPRSAQVRALIERLTEMGCAEPELDSAVNDPVTGRELAVAEAYWPDGLQTGQGSPVVLELDPEAADLARLTELGCEIFTSVDALLGFVIRRNAAAAGAPTATASADVATTSDSATAAAFDAALRELSDLARREVGHNAGYQLGMLAELGGVATARKLLDARAVSDCFSALWDRDRLDLTVEALVVRPEYERLFSAAEVDVAHRRLDQYRRQ